MAVTIKSEPEIEKMRKAGILLARVHDTLEKEIHAGMSTWEVDARGEELIRSLGGIPNFKNYEGYPASICVSINEEVVHGIPKKDRILKEGDIVSLDAGLIIQGYHSDAARTHCIGSVDEEKRKLVEVTKESFFEGIRYAREGNYLYDISAVIQDYCESKGYGVVRDLTGHGIGRHLHEDPSIPNYRPKNYSKGLRLKKGMTLAIEPMITAGTWRVKWLKDGWTVVTQDRSPAAHYENTILITDGEPEILTLQ